MIVIGIYKWIFVETPVLIEVANHCWYFGLRSVYSGHVFFFLKVQQYSNRVETLHYCGVVVLFRHIATDIVPWLCMQH